jgi:carbon-monoxide dehydrogenase small subunit
MAIGADLSAASGARMQLACTVNGERIEADVAPRLMLSDFIRHELRLTGTNVGCEMGVCGACTVIVEGAPVRSCLMFAVQADGCAVYTIEGLAGDRTHEPLRQALCRHHAFQCGYCASGIFMTLAALARQDALPRSEDAVRVALSGNICRCTGYQNTVDAVMSLAP